MKTVVESTDQSQEAGSPRGVDVRVVSGSKNWIESEAIRQLDATSQLEGMLKAVGFPDLHPGKGSPVGAAFVTEEMIYPYVIGGDIGCGMGFFQTDLLRRKARLDRWSEKLHDLEHPWDGNVQQWLSSAQLPSCHFDSALGTIGGGNHFAELQAVDRVEDRGEFEKLGLNKENLFILVHSGSRGLGESLLREFVVDHGSNGVRADSLSGSVYLNGHDRAVRWGEANRSLIAHRFASALGATNSLVWDGCHNSVSRRELGGNIVWLHRKGAAPADAGIAMIPGSRGTRSYLMKSRGDMAEFAWSLSHGAGRKWSRSESRKRIRERFRPAELVQTGLGGRVICENRDLLYEEAPDVYKKIEIVVQDLVDAGCISVIATFKPLITYKTRAIRR
ncbi:MAG: hypothetical protein JWN25_1937 [Verrucomicrobiales bacterium]|nr:hypothetical protein [Verrucomicrobiales bacterium]